MNDVMQRVLDGDIDALSGLLPFLMQRARRVAGRSASPALVEDVAHGVLEKAVTIVLRGGFPCRDVGHLEGYLTVMLRRGFCHEWRRLEVEIPSDDPATDAVATSAADMQHSWREIVETVRLLQRRVRATEDQREAFDRRVLAVVQDRNLTELLVEEGRLQRGASAEKQSAAIEADMRLQLRSLGALEAGAERAIALGELDWDTAGLALRFLEMLRERRREAAASPSGRKPTRDPRRTA